MKKVLTVLLVLIILVVLLGGAAMFLGYRISNGETNIRYVHVGQTDVTGLTPEETEGVLKRAGWVERAETPLTVTTFGGVSFTVDPVRAGVVRTVDEIAQDAFAYGHGGDPVDDLVTAVKAFLSPVDVSGLNTTVDEAYLDAAINACAEQINASLGDVEYAVDPHAAEMTVVKGWNQIAFNNADFREAIVEALARGDTQLDYTRLAAELTAPDFAAIHAELEREPADAYYTDDGTFNVVDEIVGCKFDVAEAKALWDAAAPTEAVKIPLDIVWPAVTGEQLRGQLYHDLLGACTTKFPNSGENRRNNLQLCASKLDGHILYPCETLSYNETVGERTEAAGFLPAPAYVDGDVKDEIGGGACQISSTLYAATAYAFLETVDRTAHVFPVNYMQMGTDATVTIPEEGKTIDFKFRNNRNYPIKIVMIYNNDESTITAEIWGTLEDDDYMPVEFDNTYTWQYDYDRVIEPADPDREGYTIKFSVEMWGFEDEFSPGTRTLTHRLVIDSEGNTVDDQILNATLANGNYALDTYYQHP